ncbi:MAG: diacylglyceryl transferase [Myroides sp.]|nr:diacylglyceryl transferase [Myroides sp.]
MNKLKEKWEVTSNFQLVIIFIVFAITGSTSAYVTRPILEVIGITKDSMHPVLYWPLSLILILPVYKVLLIIIGTVFGQHIFFWNFVKKMLIRMRLGFLYGIKK